MSLQQDIKNGVLEALKAKEQTRLLVLRGLSTAFTNELVAKGRKPDGVLEDEEALAVIAREAKKRKESISQFEAAGRTDLSESEKAELAIIEGFLPAQLSREDIVKFVQKKISDMGSTIPQKGQFIGAVMKDLKGTADGKIVQEVVNELLQS
jgi:hypothetical protein